MHKAILETAEPASGELPVGSSGAGLWSGAGDSGNAVSVVNGVAWVRCPCGRLGNPEWGLAPDGSLLVRGRFARVGERRFHIGPYECAHCAARRAGVSLED